VLLVALARATGIPSQLHFADIRNHLASSKAVEMMGTNLFRFHGYIEFHLEGKWIKATPAFDLETCQENKWVPVEFDGTRDAILHTHSTEDKLHIEYILDRGCYDDLPIDEILNSWENDYGLGSNLEHWNNLIAEEKAKKTANRKR